MANRVCIGKKSASQTGIYVSKPSTNVLATNASLIFDSDTQKGFNVVKHGQGRLDTNGIHTITHNLGYKPYVLGAYSLESEMSNWMTGLTLPTFNVSMSYIVNLGYYRVNTVTITNGGSGFKPSSTIRFLAQGNTGSTTGQNMVFEGDDFGAKIDVTTNSSGVCTSVSIVNRGFYQSGSTSLWRFKPDGPAEDVCNVSNPGYALVTHPMVDISRISFDSQYTFTKIMRVFEQFESSDYGQNESVQAFEVEEGVGFEYPDNNTIKIYNYHSNADGEEEQQGFQEYRYNYRGPTIYYSYLIFGTEDPFA
jgi:hypothetical protein